MYACYNTPNSIYTRYTGATITHTHVAHQKAREYMAKSRKKRRPVNIPVKKPFLTPSLVAICSFRVYLATSFSSPEKASTVLMEERTSSATEPAPAYCFCSLVVNEATDCRTHTHTHTHMYTYCTVYWGWHTSKLERGWVPIQAMYIYIYASVHIINPDE